MYEEFVKGRNDYSYPTIGLCSIKVLEDVSKWKSSYIEHDFKSTLQLDLHHNSNLLSNDDDEVLLGIYSTMYWGYVTSGAKKITRCDWLSVGNKKNDKHSLVCLGKSNGIEIVRHAAEHVKNRKYDEALLKIRELPHVGVSFGTKFLAFLDPENVGILDDKITRHLTSGSFTNLLGTETVSQLIKPENESPKKASKRFLTFCEALNVIKTEINKENLRWSDVSGAEMCRFRAIDVERALFAIAKHLDNK